MIAFFPAALLLVLWLMSAYQGFVSVQDALYPQRNVFCCNTPADAGYLYEDVTLSTSDGIALSGWYLPTQNNSAIVMAHGLHANRAQVWNLARGLHDHGYGVILFDLRAHGESEGTVFTQGWLDIRAAVDYLTSQGVERIGAYGFSLGANMVLRPLCWRISPCPIPWLA
ncbi:MAG: hypothetical protein OHK0046_12200 [Anaerolineae bacterium]